MAFKLIIELSNRDLRHFRRELNRARAAVSIADDDEILSAAADLVESLRRTELPDFIGERLQKLQVLQAMLTDVKRAQAKLVAGTYGRCDECGAEIGAERLEARPWATRCMRHA